MLPRPATGMRDLMGAIIARRLLRFGTGRQGWASLAFNLLTLPNPAPFADDVRCRFLAGNPLLTTKRPGPVRPSLAWRRNAQTTPSVLLKERSSMHARFSADGVKDHTIRMIGFQHA